MSDKLDSILSKVRGLVAMAEHPDTPSAEADTARKMADTLMLKYAIDQATLRNSQPIDERQRPSVTKVDACEAGSPYELNFVVLIGVVCDHTRTKPIFYNAQLPADFLAGYHEYSKKPTVYAKVYGFESDLKYFEILYTTLLLHMSNGIDPKPDMSLTDELNSYNLRAAGLNWAEIASIYYRLGHKSGWNGDKSDYMRFTGYWKRACAKECKRRNEPMIHIPGKVTAEARRVWRLNFAKSYVATINRRLWLARSDRTSGTEIILRSAMDDINSMIAENHRNLGVMKPTADDVPYNDQAWQAGNRHGNTADLGGTSVAGRSAGALN